MSEEEVLEAIAEVTGLALALRHLCRAIPELGTAEWDAIYLRLRAALNSLNSLFQKLAQEHGAVVPVPAAVLSLLQEGLRVKLLE